MALTLKFWSLTVAVYGVTFACVQHGSAVCRWIPACAGLFMDKKELWQHLVPPNENDSTDIVREFFSCVAALMSAQLRSLVIHSLADLLSFFEIHQVSSVCLHLSVCLSVCLCICLCVCLFVCLLVYILCLKPRLHNTTCCQTGLTTGWMFVYTIQPVVSCKPGITVSCLLVSCLRASVLVCFCICVGRS